PAPGSRRAPQRYFRPSTHLTSVAASSALTCGFAGIGIWPQTPTPPSRTFFVRYSTASLRPAYFAATSLYEGPISFLSTAWHAVQFLALARSALADAPPQATRPTARTAAV